MALVDRIAKVGAQTYPIPGSMMDAPRVKPFQEIGVSGLQRTAGVGYVYEEWLASLSTYRARQVYREMRDNDAVIGAAFFAIEMILRRAEWRVEAVKGGGKKAEDYARFVTECMEDMSHTWADFVAETVNMLAFGFSLFETTYKRRLGPREKGSSRYKDGLIGWRKFAPRAQETIMYWMWDDEGGLQGAVQLAAPQYQTVPIPIGKLLLFRTTSIKNNPEGRSLLRNCYRSWFFKRRIEEIEGIGIERDLCGLPVLYATAEALTAMGNGSQTAGEAYARKLVTNIRQDDQAGVVLPSVVDEKGNQLVRLELLKVEGRKLTNPGETLKRYNEDILNTMLAGFVQFGQTEHGARNLHLSATQIFARAIQVLMDGVAAVINRVELPRLMNLNAMDLELAPKLVPGEVGVRDLEGLGDYISKLAGAGLSFVDPQTATHLRTIAGLPAEPADEFGKPLPFEEQIPEEPGTKPEGSEEPDDEEEAGDRLKDA